MKSAMIAATLALAAGATAAPAAAKPVESAEEASREDLVAALEAVQQADRHRLLTDADYARDMLAKVDLIASAAAGNARMESALDDIRIFAFQGTDRQQEALAAGERILARRPQDPRAYLGPWMAAALAEDSAKMADVLLGAIRNVPLEQRPALFETFRPEHVFFVYHEIKDQDADAAARLADGLARIGWPGEARADARDQMRLAALHRRLEIGDSAGAGALAGGIRTPSALVPLLLLKRFDPLFPDDADRAALLERAMADYDRSTAAAVEARPEDVEAVVTRAQFLRAVGRHEEALELVRPALGDVPATVASHPEGLWLIGEGALALSALDRDDEAMALMEQMVGLDVDENPSLISVQINYAGMLWGLGRADEALAHVEGMSPAAERHASAFGRLWTDAFRVCALEDLGRAQEAEAVAAGIAEAEADNQAAAMVALLCRDQLDAAEALMLRRLRSEDQDVRTQAVLVLQEWREFGTDGEAGKRLIERFDAVRARPTIAAALEPVGRRLPMPLDNVYWTSF